MGFELIWVLCLVPVSRCLRFFFNGYIYIDVLSRARCLVGGSSELMRKNEIRHGV